MGFNEKLIKMRDAIIKEANGVTCETCLYAKFDCDDVGYCKHKENTHVLHGGPITISTRAPKCAKYEEGQEIQNVSYKEADIVNDCVTSVAELQSI